MKVSYTWLQEYFDEPLPEPEKVADLLTFHAFEIEGIETIGDDFVIDIDVLPNRSSDCLSHRGIARELATLLDRPLKHDPYTDILALMPQSSVQTSTVSDEKLCRRFSTGVIRGVKVGPSPEWLVQRLEALGQRSINNIVDATNYVMFDLGQPLHAFDSDKLEKRDGYSISVRVGKENEKITVLTEEEYIVGPSNLLITDGNADTPIGIAGVKGGSSAEVDENTSNLIIEAANFDPVSVRRTSAALKLRTDASTRFENEPSKELTAIGIHSVVALILKIAGGEVEGYTDFYPTKDMQESVTVVTSEIVGLLGASIQGDEVENILKRFNFHYTREGDSFTVTPSFERTDIAIKEDLIEEVGRVYGYEHISAVSLPELSQQPEINKGFYYAEKVRAILAAQGFSEVYTYTLRDHGDVETANPLALDKGFLRSNLQDGLKTSLDLNANNAPLLGLEVVKVFEIGPIFTVAGDYTALGIAVENTKEQSRLLKDALTALSKGLGVEIKSSEKIVEINFDALIRELPEPTAYDVSLVSKNVSYHPLSHYPHALRDVAVWTPKGTKAEEVLSVIQANAGKLLRNYSLFDEFEKEGRVSYAFHLVFLSYEKTLSEEDLTTPMDAIYRALGEKEGWEIR